MKGKMTPGAAMLSGDGDGADNEPDAGQDSAQGVKDDPGGGAGEGFLGMTGDDRDKLDRLVPVPASLYPNRAPVDLYLDARSKDVELAVRAGVVRPNDQAYKQAKQYVDAQNGMIKSMGQVPQPQGMPQGGSGAGPAGPPPGPGGPPPPGMGGPPNPLAG